MTRSLRRLLTIAIGSLTVIAAGPAIVVAQAASDQQGLSGINHIVVIYEENHSFVNLYGGWAGVNGRASATPAQWTHLTQVGAAYTSLPQNDVNLPACSLPNHPFSIDTYIPATSPTF